MPPGIPSDELIHGLHNVTTEQLNVTNKKLDNIDKSIRSVSMAIWWVFFLIPMIGFGLWLVGVIALLS
jgi:hypothetical protein